MRRFLVSVAVVTAALLVSRVGRSQPKPPAEPAPQAASPSPASPTATASQDTESSTHFVDLEKAPPPPTNVVYLQYGVALTAESPTASGPICDNSGVPCVLGAGGGIAIRVGWRSTGSLYLGGAYELSKQDANKLYRLAILQQARFEMRRYVPTGRDVEPYVSAGAGIAGYGNEWGVDTWGPGGFFGGGIEVQITRRTVVGIGVAYRLLWLKSFTDTSGAFRSAGLTQLFGLDLVLEQRDPIFTAGTGAGPPGPPGPPGTEAPRAGGK